MAENIGQNGGLNVQAGVHEQAESVHFLDYWQMLYGRKEIVIAVSLIMFVSGIFITRSMPRVYAASTLVEIQRETTNLDVFGTTISRYDPFFLKTQFEIIKSDPIIEQVVRNLRFDEILGSATGWSANSSQAAVFDRTVKYVQGNLQLDILRDTQLVSITMKLSEPKNEAPQYAVRLVNEVARVFMNWTHERGLEQKEQGLETLREEIVEVDRQISQNEDKLAEMRAKYGITALSDIDAGTASVRSQISQLMPERIRAEMTAKIKEAKYSRIFDLSTDEAVAAITSILNDSSLSPLVSEKQRLEIIEQKNAEEYGENHPEVVQTKALLTAVNGKIEERVNEIKQALRMDYEIAKQEVNIINGRLKEMEDAERELSSGISLDFQKAMTELQALKERKLMLEESLVREKMKMKAVSTSVQIIQPAKDTENPLPVSPNFALNVMLSLFIGLFFGVVIAFFVEYLDTTIKSVTDLERYLSVPAIGIVPQKMRSLNDPAARTKHSEVYRIVRMNLKSSKSLGDGKVIVITSAGAGEGKSMTAFNLSYVCAEMGERVLLIDCDFHRPRLNKILNLPRDPGLCNVIVGESELDDTIHKGVAQNLDFISSGHLSTVGVYGLVDTDEMRSVLEFAKSNYDRVIIDAPPIVGVSDSSQIVRISDGVIMVVQHRKYPRSLCKRAKDTIVSMGGNLIGCVLNNIDVSKDYSSYYYNSQYYYYYSYQNDAEA